MWVIFLVLSCAKEVPPHLRIDPPTQSREVTKVAIGAHDPLLRRFSPGVSGDWANSSDGEAVEAWAKVARRTRPTPDAWWTVITTSRGTVAVPLSLGAMLASVEVSRGEWTYTDQQNVAAWLGLLQSQARPTTRNPSAPLEWLAGFSADEKHKAAIQISTRRVLSGWLDGPLIDLSGIGQGLSSPSHTGLADTPTGQILRRRAAGANDPDAANLGLEHLEKATLHAIRWAAADGNRAQTQLLAERSEFREKHGTDPVSHHLRHAWQKLSENSSVDDSAGLAWIAVSAERIQNTCPDMPCEGLDSVSNIRRAGVWGATSDIFAQLWQLIALKAALDTFETSVDRPLLYKRLPQIVGAFAGVNEKRIELPTLRHRSASPALMISLSELLDADSVPDRNHVRIAIRKKINELCDHVASEGTRTDIQRELAILQRSNTKKLSELMALNGSH